MVDRDIGTTTSSGQGPSLARVIRPVRFDEREFRLRTEMRLKTIALTFSLITGLTLVVGSILLVYTSLAGASLAFALSGSVFSWT